jgi:hypothetical protein
MISVPIKLNLRAGLAALTNVLNRGEDVAPVESKPSSVVLLLQRSEFPDLKQLSAYAERAFNVPFATENTTNYCVFQKVLFTLMRIGPHVLSFMFNTKPYFEDQLDFVRALPLPAQRAACEKHTGWLAMNYAKGPGIKDTQYALLSRLSIEMLDASCTGAYIPGERLLIPNDGSLLRVLQSNVANVGAVGLPPLTLN